jgi:hypothetical protein
MALSEGLLKEYLNPVFVETGTYKGDGIQAALDAGFKSIVSLEARYELSDYCKKRFSNNSSVHVFYADSRTELWHFIAYTEKPITFWLDAHSCGIAYFENDKGGYDEIRTWDGESPILEELEQIARHFIKTHTILIDDWKIFASQKIINAIKDINPDYKISFRDGTYKDDILIATI